jgi:transposase
VVPDRGAAAEYGWAAGRPFRGHRQVVEGIICRYRRSFNRFKQWRAIAARYDKLAMTYPAAVVTFAVTIWLRQ